MCKFKKKDAKVKSLLTNISVALERSPPRQKKMWKVLEDTFAKESADKQTVIKKQIAHFHLKEGTSLRSHLLQFENLIRQLPAASGRFKTGGKRCLFSVKFDSSGVLRPGKPTGK
uniref:Uncharacterized protein n=1 Tax=Anopheles funestus TaxID=62324 RepID=A0A182RX10_ANOFN